MDLLKLTEFLVKSVVRKPDMVSAKQFDDEDMITIEVLVSESDMGAAIGKNGMTINAIRTIVQASSYANKMPRVKVNIESF